MLCGLGQRKSLIDLPRIIAFDPRHAQCVRQAWPKVDLPQLTTPITTMLVMRVVNFALFA
jgi:hypothetical protein